jgi:hypothetical protein
MDHPAYPDLESALIIHAHYKLLEIRTVLLKITWTLRSKAWQTSGLQANSRTNRRLRELEKQIARLSYEYRDTYSALVELGSLLPGTEWATTFRPLLQEDVRLIPSHGQGQLSWIWMFNSP